MKLKFIAVFLMAFALIAAIGVQAEAQTTTHNAAISWGAVSVTGATYNVLRSNSATGTFVVVTSGLTSPSYTDANLTANTTYCYEIIASVAGLADSDPTAPACGQTKSDKAPTPGGPVIVIMQ